MVVLLPVGKIVVGSNVVGNSVSDAGRRGVGFGLGRFVGSVITTVKKGAGVGRGWVGNGVGGRCKVGIQCIRLCENSNKKKQ